MVLIIENDLLSFYKRLNSLQWIKLSLSSRIRLHPNGVEEYKDFAQVFKRCFKYHSYADRLQKDNQAIKYYYLLSSNLINQRPFLTIITKYCSAYRHIFRINRKDNHRNKQLRLYFVGCQGQLSQYMIYVKVKNTFRKESMYWDYCKECLFIEILIKKFESLLFKYHPSLTFQQNNRQLELLIIIQLQTCFVIFFKIKVISFILNYSSSYNNNIFYKMSDQYQEYQEDDYQYDQNQGQMQVEEEDMETKVQLQYFQAEELHRKGQLTKCVDSLQHLYKISDQNQLKNWKVKILNLLLLIYCKSNDNEKIKETLQKISILNQKEKYTQNAIKSIIITIKSLKGQSYKHNRVLMFQFIEQLDVVGQIRSYLLFLERAVQEKQIDQAQRLFKIIEDLCKNSNQIPSSSLLELYSLEIKQSKITKKDISQKLKKMELKIPLLQSQAYMSQGHISILKQAIAEICYLDGNYQECALYLSQAFQENVKYGKNSQLKDILKLNVLITLLNDNSQIASNQKYNPLFHQSTSPFKTQVDVQALYGLVQSFNNCDIEKFKMQSNIINFKLQEPYLQVYQNVIFKLKKLKLIEIVKPYSKIKLSYLQRRVDAKTDQIQKMLFELIVDNRIRGRLHMKNQKIQPFLQLYEQPNALLSIQLQNIRELSKRYLV